MRDFDLQALTSGMPVVLKGDSGAPLVAALHVTPEPLVATVKGDADSPLAAGVTINGGKQPLGAAVTLAGDASHPLAAALSGTLGARADVTVEGGQVPLATTVGLRDTTITFKLFGLLPILTIRIQS